MFFQEYPKRSVFFELFTPTMRTELQNFFVAFTAVFVRFRSDFVMLWASLTASFPRTPKPCVVCSVVRNAPQPLLVFFTDREGGALFCFWLPVL